MEETSEKLLNFSIGIDLLGPDPTSSKNKAEFKKKSQVARFANLSKTSCCKFWPKDIHCEQNRHQLVIQHLKAKFPFLLLFLNLLCTLLSPDNPTEAGKFPSQ